ncbi:MAG TPA: hypothetical protein VHD63_11665, partial [Ktedonobacteraceae bacterium]|nr:hypothetical protein [Ktedonobacteraceae bacterium]
RLRMWAALLPDVVLALLRWLALLVAFLFFLLLGLRDGLVHEAACNLTGATVSCTLVASSAVARSWLIASVMVVALCPLKTLSGYIFDQWH